MKCAMPPWWWDVREGGELGKLPPPEEPAPQAFRVRLVFLETDDRTLMRVQRDAPRRPHPLGTDLSVAQSIQSEPRERLATDTRGPPIW